MLRIDDTDNERSSKEYEDAIKEDLTWMNINWDSLKGNLLDFYLIRSFRNFIRKKRAYPCFETAEELSLKEKAN